MKFLIVIFSVWIINGGIKFILNALIHKKKAFSLIGYGGFPSTHTAIVTSMLAYIGFKFGWQIPEVGILMVLLWVVTNDARSLRKIVEKHSQHLNKIDITQNHRERVGHSICEILGGGAVGLIMGYLLSQIL